MQNFKIYFINLFSLMTAQFTNIDDALKIVLLLISIGYTLHRWYLLAKRKNETD
jgi:hypothetical protein|tara:strand:+ start:555 stop:716 length:162 start_codon:yes stop_codon:yes gene_type:complete